MIITTKFVLYCHFLKATKSRAKNLINHFYGGTVNCRFPANADAYLAGIFLIFKSQGGKLPWLLKIKRMTHFEKTKQNLKGRNLNELLEEISVMEDWDNQNSLARSNSKSLPGLLVSMLHNPFCDFYFHSLDQS